MGLLKAIEYEIEMLKKAGNYETNFIRAGEPYVISNKHELILFRIFQEVLNNIVKHARATVVTATVYFNPDNFIMEVTDNGIGFDLLRCREIKDPAWACVTCKTAPT